MRIKLHNEIEPEFSLEIIHEYRLGKGYVYGCWEEFSDGLIDCSESGSGCWHGHGAGNSWDFEVKHVGSLYGYGDGFGYGDGYGDGMGFGEGFGDGADLD